LKEGLDIARIRHLILSSYMGIMFSYLSKRYEYDAVSMVREGLGALFDGLKK
jgi:hypothetical protein